MGFFRFLPFKYLSILILLFVIYIFFYKKNNIFDYTTVKKISCKNTTINRYKCDIDIDYNGKKQYIYNYRRRYPLPPIFPEVGQTVYISYNKDEPDKIIAENIGTYYINKYRYIMLIFSVIICFYLNIK